MDGDRGLLGRLSDRVAEALLKLGGPVAYGSGEIVLREGGEDGHAVLVLTGAVKVRASDEAGDAALLAVLSAGNLVGEMAALDGRPRSATVVACGPVTGRLIPQHQLLDFLEFHREVLVELFRVRADQVRWANELRRAMPHHAATRIARVLGHLVRHHGSRTTAGWTLDLPLTNVELASIAGMKSRTAEKAFSRLRDAGIVMTSTRRAVVVPDLPRLDLIATGRHLP
ncbi:MULTISPECIES: Crp/Fnr family transcriptional regulator [unclassified Saccharothrix]|uniref:Crp/Fnr family transcriptional regulator n=1 Tax=unclassified Saccharothrix TaxID=2593673 RepID=UPI00307D8357